jgi:hypothetical protein
VRFFITVASMTHPPTRLIETPWAGYHTNRLYVCPQCGDTWARWVKEPTDLLNYYEEWHPFRRSCPNHQLGQWPGDRPGSLLLTPEDTVVLPRELLLRELFLNAPQPEEVLNEQS